MPKFQFEAMQWTGDNTDEVIGWMITNGGQSASYHDADPDQQRCREIRFDARYMPRGKTFAQVGDWISLGADGEFYTHSHFSKAKFTSMFAAVSG